MRGDLGLVMLWMLSAAKECDGTSPPGKPALVGCRSPEKETFTCWWKPGSDGGLPTTHRLYYEKEKEEGIHECPDYHSAGNNSCFFGKNYTSIWVEYSLRVVAFNALGNASSDTLDIDVMKVLKSDAPEAVTVLVDENLNTPCLNISWKRPSKVDVTKGWVSLTYELRVKVQTGLDWMMFTEVAQNSLRMYNIEPGVTYEVQVRCSLDHSSWSDWSKATFVEVPGYFRNQRLVWTLVFVFSLIPFLAAICILILKRKLVKQWILPPIPGPKIKGLDAQLFKSGRSEDVANALIANQNFPPTSVCMDQTEEYLLVSESNDWLLTDPYRSQRKKKSLLTPSDLNLDPEIQREVSTPGHSDREKSKSSEDEKDDFTPTSRCQSKENMSNTEPLLLPPPEKHQNSSVNVVNEDAALLQTTCENVVQAVAGYVDIQQGENTQEVGVEQWAYSQVKEVDETILLIKSHNLPVSSASQPREGSVAESVPTDYSRVKEVKGDNMVILHKDLHKSLCKKKEALDTEWTNQNTKMPHSSDCSKGMCLEMIGDGYVDSVPRFSTE
ncbi:prolactin receptor b [Nothobranchius furzeri]|uniref:Prolactin receptor b n=1 Tax=Nothobranchius furzeri TaxID=105023 RepID=A0A8C6VZM4_NOTFU